MATVETPAELVQTALEAQRDRLLRRLRYQRLHGAALWNWYHGRQDAPVVPSQYGAAYRLILDIARTPWARLVVDTIAERLHVQGFHSAGAGVDAAAWRVYESSSLDADEWQVYTEALITGVGYVSISAGASMDELAAAPPRLAPESGFELTHEPTPGNRRLVAAALKLFPLDWTGLEWMAELYRPEATYRWTLELVDPLNRRKENPHLFPIDEQYAGRDARPLDWVPTTPFETPNPLTVVPVVPFENRATVLGGGVSELEDCLPILRRIDKLTLDKLLTSETASFRQRWATGLEVPRDENGQPVEPYKAAVDRLWVSEDPETRFGSFDASDLNPYLAAIDAEIAALAAISRVPAHYLLQQNLANPPSADSLVAAESGLVAKVRERQRRFGEAWERAVRLAFQVAGEDDPGAQLEVVWSDAEIRNPAQVADAAVKMSTLGVPQRAIWEYLGATPQQVAQWSVESAAETLLAPPAPTPGQGGATSG